jgi:hypothetical protein
MKFSFFAKAIGILKKTCNSMRYLFCFCCLVYSFYVGAFPILEKGVGPFSFDPSLAFNQSTWVVTWNQEGNIGGKVAYSFFDPQSQQMSTAYDVLDLFGIKPKIKINSINQGIILINTTKNELLSCAFSSLPIQSPQTFKVNASRDYPTTAEFVYLDNGFGFCVFKDTSSQIFYSFYNSRLEKFEESAQLYNLQVGSCLLCGAHEQKALIVFSDLGDNQLFFTFYNQKKQAFSPFKQIPGSQNCCNARISINKEGKGILTWNTGASTSLAGEVCYSLLDFSSETFSITQKIPDETTGFNPAVQINNQGKALLCWTRLTATGKNSLPYSFLDTDQKSFEKPMFFQDTSIYTNSCEISLNNHNQAIMCWFATLSGRVEYAVFDQISKTFSSAKFIAETGINSQYPKLHLNDRNKAVMVWSVFGGIEYAVFDADTQSFSRAKLIQK